MSDSSPAPLDPALAADATEAFTALLQMLRLHGGTAHDAAARALRSWEGPYAETFRNSHAAAEREAAGLQDQLTTLLSRIAAAGSSTNT